jgi:prepilin-type N-terminal cleavage/methylation domain-containing protein
MTTLRLRRVNGFSLIEILIVIVIMGILAAIAIPMYLHQREKARDANAREGGRTIAIATQIYILESDDEEQAAPPIADKGTLTPTYLDLKDWPQNMHADRDMQIGDGDGDYDYERTDSARRFTITVHLAAADDFIVP